MVVTEALDVVGWVENAAMLATPADGNERHLGIDELTQRSVAGALPIG